MKVLIVDDNEELAYTLQCIVERETECRAQIANDGKNGYDAYLNFKPDVVITDIEMPGKNGFELMHAIRIHDPEIRTIYMSGDPISFRSQVEAERQKYPVTFLDKPFSFEKLKRLLSQLPCPEVLKRAS